MRAIHMVKAIDPRSRGAMRPSLAIGPPSKGGCRECRVRVAPAVSCAKMQKGAHTSIQVQTEQSGIPCAMALRLMPCSPRRANSSCHRRQRIDGSPEPGWADMPPRTWRQQRASGPHGFAVREMRRSSRTLRTAHEFDLAPRLPCAPTRSRPPHPVPRFVTTRDPPSCRVGTVQR
jgi:hypothetical protein